MWRIVYGRLWHVPSLWMSFRFASVRFGALYHVLSDTRSGYAEQHPLARREGTHTILESQTFDMNEYRAQKDKLEIEAMKRNSETAYLVDKETFDNRLDELGAFDAMKPAGCMWTARCTT